MRPLSREAEGVEQLIVDSLYDLAKPCHPTPHSRLGGRALGCCVWADRSPSLRSNRTIVDGVAHLRSLCLPRSMSPHPPRRNPRWALWDRGGGARRRRRSRPSVDLLWCLRG